MWTTVLTPMSLASPAMVWEKARQRRLGSTPRKNSIPLDPSGFMAQENSLAGQRILRRPSLVRMEVGRVWVKS